MTRTPTQARAGRRVQRLSDVLRSQFGKPYRVYARSVSRPMTYWRWIGTLSKNQQIRHKEMQRRLDQALRITSAD